MDIFAVTYSYDDRTAERDAVRPEHRAYLDALSRDDIVVAFGRFEDDGAPGALIVVRAVSADAVERVIAGDPYVRAGLVVAHEVRRWPAKGPWVR